MGNICGKQSEDNFSQPGRAVGAAPSSQTQPARAPVPNPAQKVQGPGRTVGGSGGAEGGAGEDPRAAAARAAEERAKKTQTQARGKLGEQLAAQKKQTRTDTLEQASRETRGYRDADENAVNRSWN